MPRSTRTPEMPTPTPRGPRHLRTSSSDSDPLQQRPISDNTPKLGDRRSPRGSQSDPLKQKKLGTRITDLETQLVQAQQELKCLKFQLTSAEKAKKHSKEELVHKKLVKKPTIIKRVQGREKKTPSALEPQDKPINQETDVFEVPIDDGKETELLKPDNPSLCEELEAKELENESLKKQLEEAKAKIAEDKTKEEEMTSKMSQLEHELESSLVNETKLKEKLQTFQEEKEYLEVEMKKMKVQTEQWRKAADAAAAVLSGGPANVNGRISGRCASMDNHFNGIFEAPMINGFGGGFIGSPGDDVDDGFGVGKKKGTGIRIIGDLWKKKGGHK